MKKLKELKLFDELYVAEIIFLHGGSADELISLISERHGDTPMYSWGVQFKFGEDANTTDGYQFHVNAVHGAGETFYLWMLNTPPSLFYHEIFHLAGDVLYTRGVEYCYESEEAYAYYGGWLFEKILKGSKIKMK